MILFWIGLLVGVPIWALAIGNRKADLADDEEPT